MNVKETWSTAIAKINNKFDKYRFIILLIFMAAVVTNAWLSDDAYHAYVMARNLVEGNGFVYNVGTRVNATTCPLFTLIVALFYAIFKNMYFVGVLLNVFMSCVSFAILLYKFCNSFLQGLLICALLINSFSFLSFTTSGLETSCLFLLGIILIYLALNIKKSSALRYLEINLIFWLLAFTRMDSVLVFLPFIICLFFSEKCINIKKKIGLSLLGTIPFMLWEIFSIVYYGYLFPNTLYAKLNTGFDRIEYLTRGLQYYRDSLIIDVVLIIVPVLSLLLSLFYKKYVHLQIICGVFLYYGYVLYIGGDFMVGRLLTYPFFVSIVCLVDLMNISMSKQLDYLMIVTILAVVQLLTYYTFGSNRLQFMNDQLGVWSETSVADERNFYYDYTGLIPHIIGLISGRDTVELYINDELESVAYNGSGQILDFLPGMLMYYANENKTVYLTDKYALMDPLLSHLPAVKTEKWRIGHMYRDIPKGYRETVAAGENMIDNPSLKEYFDKITIITQGKLFDKERIRTVFEMKLHKYDYLLKDYITECERNI